MLQKLQEGGGSQSLPVETATVQEKLDNHRLGQLSNKFNLC